MMKINDKRGVTYIEYFISIVLMVIVLKIFADSLYLQKNMLFDHILNAEYNRQTFFAESYIKRDLFSGQTVTINQNKSLLIIDDSGNQIEYYLAKDPYENENLYKKESKTLYRRVNNGNAMPITQFFKEVEFSIEERDVFDKFSGILRTEKSELKFEVYYEKNN